MPQIDMQKMVDTLNDMSRDDRSKYHLTLGQLIEILEEVPFNYVVQIDDADISPGELMSYRGYYSDLAMDRCPSPIEAGRFLSDLKDCLGAKFEGYKGGDFYMDAATPLWVSEYGLAEGYAVMNVSIIKDRELVRLETKKLEI